MGGSSGNDGNFYANQDKLFGAQADIAQNLYNQYANYAPGYLNNSSQMVNEANSGTLGQRARTQAGADSSQAFGQMMAASGRDTARYGTEFNADRMAQRQQDAALTGAANKAGAMNSAGQWAEDQRWNRNANAYGQISGMGSGAMQGMGSAGAGYGQMSSQQQSSNAANAAGMGKFGSAIGTAMYKADGGYIEKRGLKMAAGGPVPMAKVDWRSQPTNVGGRRNGFAAGAGQLAMGMAPYIIAHEGKGLLQSARGLFGRDSAVQGNSTYDSNGYYSTGPSDPNYADAPNYADTSTATYDSNGYYSTGPSDPNYAEATNYADAATTSGDVASTGSEFTDAGEMLARGGYVRKRGLHLARGGSVPPGVATSNPARAQSYRSDSGPRPQGVPVLGLARNARRVMNTSSTAPTRTTPDGVPASSDSSMVSAGTAADASSTGSASIGASNAASGGASSGMESASAGETGSAGAASAAEGTGESSASTGSPAASYGSAALSLYSNAQQARYTPNDKDGFGKHTPDYRHAVGSAVISYYVPGLGNYIADAVDPYAEPATREMIMAGDKIGGAGGALMTDPAGAISSGKYTGAELVKGAILGPADKFLSSGGPAGRGLPKRKDFRPGGKVAGPGTETSDDIPAWLSDGEYVLNAEAVKLIGKDKLDAANQRGLQMRGRKEEVSEGTPRVKDSPKEEAVEKRGRRVKRQSKTVKKGA